MAVEKSAEARQKRILMATLTVKDYMQMDKDGDGKISPLEFLCRTLVKQVSPTTVNVGAVLDATFCISDIAVLMAGAVIFLLLYVTVSGV